jgi:hypothetical protein
MRPFRRIDADFLEGSLEQARVRLAETDLVRDPHRVHQIEQPQVPQDGPLAVVVVIPAPFVTTPTW